MVCFFQSTQPLYLHQKSKYFSQEGKFADYFYRSILEPGNFLCVFLNLYTTKDE
jgi:hypothetical protein